MRWRTHPTPTNQGIPASIRSKRPPAEISHDVVKMMDRTLFLIHGMWCGAWCWDDFRHVLEDRGHRCIATTLRHHEEGPPPGALGRTGLLDFADDLEAEIAALSERPILIGHSMGGLLAQILAARGRAAAAVCLTPAPPMGILAVRRPSVFMAFASGTMDILLRRPMRPSYRALRHAVYHRMSDEDSRRLWNRSVAESGRAISEIGMRTYRRLVPYFDPDRASAVDEGRVHCPMLVVGARHDRITPLPIAEKVAEKFGADYHECVDHGHWVLGEPGWERVAKLVAEWIEDL